MTKKNNISDSCRDLIRRSYAQLTKQEKRFADFALKDHRLIYESITDAVERSGVSYGTVMRFCKRLGYSGFQEFKVQLAQDPALRGEAKRGGSADFVERAAERVMEDIRDTARDLSRDALERAAKILAGARTVLAAGSAASAVTAKEIEYQLTRLGVGAIAVEDNHMQLVRAASLTSRDAAFFVSYSGSTKDSLAAAETARKAGAAVICLTNFPRSPLADPADVVLATSIRREPLAAEVASKAAADFALDVLFERVRALKRGARAHMKKTFRAASERQM